MKGKSFIIKVKIDLNYNNSIMVDNEDIKRNKRLAHSQGSNVGKLNSLFKSRSDYGSDGIDMLSFFKNK